MKIITIGSANGYIAHAREHAHPYDEIILTLSGSGTTTLGGQRYAFHAGTIECIPAGMPHAKDSQARFRDIFLGAEGIDVQTDGKAMLLEDDAEKTVEHILLMALRAHHRADQAKMAEALVCAVCEYVRCALSQANYDDEVERFKNHIIENYTDPDFRIGEAESKFGYCTDYLRRRFRQDMGMTPVAYLNHLRLEYACRCARENRDDMPVANLALMSGYYDAHYFARLFKKYTGVSPREYMAATFDETQS